MAVMRQSLQNADKWLVEDLQNFAPKSPKKVTLQIWKGARTRAKAAAPPTTLRRRLRKKSTPEEGRTRLASALTVMQKSVTSKSCYQDPRELSL